MGVNFHLIQYLFVCKLELRVITTLKHENPTAGQAKLFVVTI